MTLDYLASIFKISIQDITHTLRVSFFALPPIVYFITVRNAGAVPATNVTFTDITPPNTAFIAAGYPSSAACWTPAIGGTGTFACTMATLSGSIIGRR